MNTTVITGHLGSDPESFYTTDGTHILSFPVAFRSGKDKTSWIKVTCFNSLAELAAKCLHKGAKIGVSGHLDQEKWLTKEGEHRSSYKIIAGSIEFIKTDGRGFEGKKEAEDAPADDEIAF